MSHVAKRHLHLYKARGLTFTCEIAATAEAADLSDTTFRVDTLTVAGLSAVDTATGFDIDVTLTAAETDTLPVGVHTGELFTTIAGEVVTLMVFITHVAAEPTA